MDPVGAEEQGTTSKPSASPPEEEEYVVVSEEAFLVEASSLEAPNLHPQEASGSLPPVGEASFPPGLLAANPELASAVPGSIVVIAPANES